MNDNNADSVQFLIFSERRKQLMYWKELRKKSTGKWEHILLEFFAFYHFRERYD